MLYYFFFFNDTATTEIYTLSLHDALPISVRRVVHAVGPGERAHRVRRAGDPLGVGDGADRVGGEREGDDPRALAEQRSEEHTSELQSRQYLVCRLLLEKKKKYQEISNVSI